MTTALPIHLTARHRLSGIAIAVLGVAALIWLTVAIGGSAPDEIWRLLAVQTAALAVAAGGVVAVRAVVHTRSPRAGDMRAPVRPVRARADDDSDTPAAGWLGMGVRLSAVVVALTLVLVIITRFDQLTGVPPAVWGAALLLAIPLSAASALGEELIVRWAVVASMRGPWASAAPWVSGALSGCLHWFVVPGGAIGAITAAALGWVLARSVQDTRGIGWAWLIHGCHDVVVFTAVIALMLA